MLNDGFKDELDLILNQLPQKRQNLFFSATYNDKIKETINKISTKYIFVQASEELNVSNINQRAISVNKENRNALLKVLLKKYKYKKVLVFMATQKQTDNVAYKFRKNGFIAESFHGNLDQEDRNYTLNDFKDTNINILFCTDLASRGLHIDDVDCVVNFDLPRSPLDYIHRIGRTARAGKSGDAITFVTLENEEHFKLIQKKCHLNIEIEQINGFERTGEVIKTSKGQAPIKGKRKSKKDKLRELEGKK
jgi:superfamily II DNA/RNA helicase